EEVVVESRAELAPEQRRKSARCHQALEHACLCRETCAGRSCARLCYAPTLKESWRQYERCSNPSGGPGGGCERRCRSARAALVALSPARLRLPPAGRGPPC